MGSRKLGRETPEASTPGDAAFDWDDFYRRHAPGLRRLITNRVAGAAAVEDVLQDTFIRAFRSRDRFDPTRPEWPWLATLAHRSCVRWWRTHDPSDLPVGDESDDTVGAALSPGSDDHLLQLEQARVVAAALAELAPRHRRVLYLHEAEDVSYESLAEGEAIGYKALKSLLCRARDHFRQHYIRLSEESAVALAFGRGVLARLRSRLSEREVVGWERVGSLAGMVFTVGIVGVLTVPGSAPPARAQADGIVAVRALDTVPASVVASPVPGQATADGRLGTPGKRAAPADRTSSRGDAPMPGAAERAPIGVNTGGGLAHGPDSSSASVWVEVEKSVVGQKIRVGTEVRCDAGKVYTAECTVLRMLPPTD